MNNTEKDYSLKNVDLTGYDKHDLSLHNWLPLDNI